MTELTQETLIPVKNRNAGSTGYVFDNGFHRKFEHNETKRVPLSELQQLSFIPGGEYILKNCLVIDSKPALDFLNIEVEPEYYYFEEDIRELLLNGTLDQLEDTLNFAPAGVIEIVKQMAVSEKIPDVRKREMITEKTGFNVDNAININKMLADEGADAQIGDYRPQRKAEPITRKETTEDKPKVKITRKA